MEPPHNGAAELMIKLTLSLPCPLNQMMRSGFFRKGNRMIPYSYLSPTYRARRKRLVAEVWQQLGGKPEPTDKECQLSFTIYPRDKRIADVDAYDKALQDGLMMAGIVKDDKQFVQVSKERMPTPEWPGRIEVEIREIIP